MTLLYRRSRDGGRGKDFYKRCNLKSPTISLFKVKNGPCIGGYTEAKWNKSRSTFISDPAAFLFSLTAQLYFPVKNHKNAIYCKGNWGPTFGFDLRSFNEPNDFDDNYFCRLINSIYRIGVDSTGRNLLSQSDND